MASGGDQPSSVASTVISTESAMARLMGQPSLAAAAFSWKSASSMPGTLARSLLAGLLAVGSDHMVPRFAQVLVITAAVLTGLAQTAIDISFVSDVLIILLAFFFGGLSLAFALGSRQLVENLLARRALDRYRIGDHVRINGSQGTIIEILNTAVVLEAEHGILTVPTSRFADSEVLLVEDKAADDDASGTE